MEEKSRAGKLLDRLDELNKKSGSKSITEKRDEIGDAKSFNVLTDDEIGLVLAYRSYQIRVDQNKQQFDVSKAGGMKGATYASFERTGKTTLSSFIKTMRGLGRIKELEGLLVRDIGAKLSELEVGEKRAKKQRVRKSTRGKNK